MVTLYKSPEVVNDSDNVKMFLGGTIEMGNSVDWQSEVVEALDGYNVDIYNPRRSDWDSSWKQSITNEKFVEQVTWELDHIEKSDVVIFNILADSKSPITLMEIGLVSNLRCRVLICCEDGFWRKGNIEVMCERYNMDLFDNMNELLEELKNIL